MAKKKTQEDTALKKEPVSQEISKGHVNMISSEAGTITFTEKVLGSIVTRALSDIEGLSGVKQKSTDLVSIFGGGQKGIKINFEADGLKVAINVSVCYGEPIHKIAQEIQQRTKTELERMTSLQVSGVDVFVRAIQIEQEQSQVLEAKD